MNATSNDVAILIRSRDAVTLDEKAAELLKGLAAYSLPPPNAGVGLRIEEELPPMGSSSAVVQPVNASDPSTLKLTVHHTVAVTAVRHVWVTKAGAQHSLWGTIALVNEDSSKTFAQLWFDKQGNTHFGDNALPKSIGSEIGDICHRLVCEFVKGVQDSLVTRDVSSLRTPQADADSKGSAPPDGPLTGQ